MALFEGTLTTLKFIQPGKPIQNAIVERFNRTFRNEVLKRHLFESLQQVRDLTQEWICEYGDHEGSLSCLPYF